MLGEFACRKLWDGAGAAWSQGRAGFPSCSRRPPGSQPAEAAGGREAAPAGVQPGAGALRLRPQPLLCLAEPGWGRRRAAAAPGDLLRALRGKLGRDGERRAAAGPCAGLRARWSPALGTVCFPRSALGSGAAAASSQTPAARLKLGAGCGDQLRVPKQRTCLREEFSAWKLETKRYFLGPCIICSHKHHLLLRASLT